MADNQTKKGQIQPTQARDLENKLQTDQFDPSKGGAMQAESTPGGRREGAGRKAQIETPFSRWLAQSGISRRELCEKLGIKPPSLSQITLGQNEPSLENILIIEELSQGAITLKTWVEQRRARENKPPTKKQVDS